MIGYTLRVGRGGQELFLGRGERLAPQESARLDSWGSFKHSLKYLDTYQWEIVQTDNGRFSLTRSWAARGVFRLSWIQPRNAKKIKDLADSDLSLFMQSEKREGDKVVFFSEVQEGDTPTRAFRTAKGATGTVSATHLEAVRRISGVKKGVISLLTHNGEELLAYREGRTLYGVIRL